MTELILGTTDFKFFEILECETTIFGFKKYRDKVINAQTLMMELSKVVESADKEKELFSINKFDTFNNNLVSHKKTVTKDILVFDFKERYIRTFYNEKYYKILHCNAFIKLTVIGDKISTMEIYPYSEYKGKETELYNNPYPNMFSGNKTCMGTADRTVEDDYEKSILKILETAYTHHTTQFKSSELKGTVNAFEYLKTNPFPYDQMFKTNIKLKDII